MEAPNPYPHGTPEYAAFEQGYLARQRGERYENSYSPRSSLWAAYRRGFVYEPNVPLMPLQ